MKSKKKDIIVLLLIIIYIGVLITYSNADNDLIWNYGFSYNIASGLTMYKDFNMVITPLYPALCGLFMRLFGNNFISFNIINTFLISSMYYYIYKKYPKTFLPSFVLLSFIIRSSYNFLVMFLLLILLNIKEDNDYLIGFLLGLVALTKQSFLLLIIPSIIYIKKPKKIIKRIIGFMIPVLITLIYMISTNSLYSFINYTFLGLFSFGSKNSFLNIGTVIIIALVIYLFTYYLKHKDVKVLYLITYQIMAYPIFNVMHVLFSIIPVIIYLSDKFVEEMSIKKGFNWEYAKYINYMMIILLICPVLSIALQYRVKALVKGTGILEYKNIDNKYLDNMKLIEKEIPSLDNTYFIMYDAYFYKYLLNKKIGSYDLLLNGNLGYKGEERVIEYFNSLDKDSYFLLNKEYEGGQLSKEIDSYIRNNYVKVKTFSSFVLYKRY